MMPRPPLSHQAPSQELCNLREKNMMRFATLLGTFSLNENEPVISLRHTQPNDKKVEFAQQHGQLEKLLIASSCNALRGMMSNHSETMSSFPALVLNSFGWGQVSPDMAQKEQVASFFVGRPIVFLPPRRVDMDSSVEYNTTQKSLIKQNKNDDYDKTELDGKKSAALDPKCVVGSRRQRRDYESSVDLEAYDVGTAIQKVEDIARVSSQNKNHNNDKTELNRKERSDLDPMCAVGNKRQREDYKSNIDLEEDDVSAAIQKVEDIARVPYLMMSNFSSSFALLLEARLRAYGNILKRHIATFSHDTSLNLNSNSSPQHDDDCVDSSMLRHDGCPMTTQIKLNTLVAIGEHMEVNGVVTTFHVQECTPISFPKYWRDVNSVDDNILTLPITFEAIVDISIPEHSQNEWQSNTVTVAIQTSGTITGFYEEGSSSLFTQVHVQLDTRKLVSQMINKACDVVLKATQNANAAISDPKGTPSGPHHDADQVDLQPVGKSLPCSISQVTDYISAVPSQMVTPEITPKASNLMPCEFTLDGKKKSPLSTKDGINEDCAAIIDYAIGNFSS